MPPWPKRRTMSIKIIVLGDSGVGKSSLIHLICHSSVLASPQWTIGCSIDVKLYRDQYFLEFWDIGGSRNHKIARSFIYQHYHGIMLVYDATNKKSRANLFEWLAEAYQVPTIGDLESSISHQVPVVTVATKIDMLPKASTYQPPDPILGDIVCVNSQDACALTIYPRIYDQLDKFFQKNKIVSERGYILETHTITTSDGYILGLHRIVNPLVPFRKTIGSVIVQHGIMCASVHFVFNSERNERPKIITARRHSPVAEHQLSDSLAFSLSNWRYDVWLPNFRGNQYSRRHQNATHESSAQYWNFSVDEHIYFDADAYVTYIKDVTNRQQIAFVGHSLGTTVGLGTLVADPAHRTHLLRPMILMSPVASTKYMRGMMLPMFKLVACLYPDLSSFPGSLYKLHTLLQTTCVFWPKTCAWFAGTICGRNDYDPRSVRIQQAQFLDIVIKQSTSVHVLNHIIQTRQTGLLRRYDHGDSELNMQHYGQNEPPEYRLDTIHDAHLAIISGQSDLISTRDEVDWIKNKTGVTPIEDYVIPRNTFSHLDFIVSKETATLVNKKVIEILQRYYAPL
ncbi:Lipase member K [Fragariocoptes setiger]|uniref:Lipase member K n=1 Tax=Fragariocoptes setiger TaxID=1670756 RepID=A0ABQ7SB61_9ACAR|nr:Lipase member K [Fragariocoptes setiger]